MATQPDPEDLTARARIRDAALQHFGEHGFERATIRGIADTAGVSPGLVRHHFGSKQGLREACDDYLVKMVRRFNDQVRTDTQYSDLTYVAASRAALKPYQRYLARALVEGAAASLFDEMVKMSEEWLTDIDAKRSEPPFVSRKVRATLGTAMALGVPLLYQHVSRGMGVDIFSPEGDRLLSRAMLDIYSHPLISPEEAAMLIDALDKAPDRATPAEREATPGRPEEHHDD
ncbi:TetR/AcrR family transcriptional regulator [Sphaerisporangium perillae]|uniref:TetR/AcrR family transcriptional regulator n=1 Tax=Sphaerisporangium perillae TaxID=2935860 RepID=UPI00200D1853|nr:TetR family transcriptional regulator [Sphaerisporangium perillae]